MDSEQAESAAGDKAIEQLFQGLTNLEDEEGSKWAGEAMVQLFEEVKKRADTEVAAAHAAQQHAEIEQARAEERAAGAVQAKEDESRRHAEELRRLEKAYEDRTEALVAAAAAHQARAERAEAEIDRLREELAAAKATD